MSPEMNNCQAVSQILRVLSTENPKSPFQIQNFNLFLLNADCWPETMDAYCFDSTLYLGHSCQLQRH